VKTALAGFLLLWVGQCSGQTFTLTDVIEIAKSKSFTSISANNNLKLAKLKFQSFKLASRPLLSFNANIPAYNKDNYAVTQPDGSIKFLPRSQNFSNAGFAFSQPLLFSNGSISVNTDLYRFDNFTARSKQYNGTPVFIRLSQPIFKYNEYKWNKRIAPLRLMEEKQSYISSNYMLAYDVCKLFFSVITAQEDEKLATSNLESGNTNLAIEKRRVQLGVSTEDKVFTLEMQQIKNEQQLTLALFNKRQALAELFSYLNVNDSVKMNLRLPEKLPEALPLKDVLVEKAKQNMPQYISFQIRSLEAAAKLEQIKKEGKQIDLTASYGLNNAAADIPSVYRNPQSQQRFNIGFNIPIADWGKRKNSFAIAKFEQEQTEIKIKQEEEKLLLEIRLIADKLAILKNNIDQSLSLDTLSQKRFAITNRLFQSGKASLLELQSSQFEKDNARRNYINALRAFWENWYMLKSKTLLSF
jgi:outer membrane protein